jgi:hypothetical protein
MGERDKCAVDNIAVKQYLYLTEKTLPGANNRKQKMLGRPGRKRLDEKNLLKELIS